MDNNELENIISILNRQLCKKYSYIDSIKQISGDIVQESIFKVLKYSHLKLEINNIGYIYNVCKNTAADYFKKKESMVSLNDDGVYIEAADSKKDFETIVAENETISNILANLDEKESKIIWLRYVKDLSFKEISEITGLNQNTALSIHHRAITRLRGNFNFYSKSSAKTENTVKTWKSLKLYTKTKKEIIMTNNISLMQLELMQMKERCHSLAVQLAFKSSLMGRGEGFDLAIVAEAARDFSYKLHDIAVEPVTGTDTKKLADICAECELLALNACIVGIRSFNNSLMYLPQDRHVYIVAEELRNLAVELKAVIEKDKSRLGDYSFDVPTVKYPNKISMNDYGFLSFKIGGEYFAENAQMVKEILHYRVSKNIENGRLKYRDIDAKYIDIYKELEIEKPKDESSMRVVVFFKQAVTRETFAVPVDCVNINAIFISNLGTNSANPVCKFGSRILRESWETNLSRTINFVDWELYL